MDYAPGQLRVDLRMGGDGVPPAGGPPKAAP